MKVVSTQFGPSIKHYFKSGDAPYSTQMLLKIDFKKVCPYLLWFPITNIAFSLFTFQKNNTQNIPSLFKLDFQTNTQRFMVKDFGYI